MDTVATQAAPAAIGPYSQAVTVGGMIYSAGQIALHPDTMELVGGDVVAQTKQVFANLEAVLEAAGSSLARVVKTTVYL
ncbi:MAG: Rid family hydrolase, partial [Gemmatimonadales bacterium]